MCRSASPSAGGESRNDDDPPDRGGEPDGDDTAASGEGVRYVLTVVSAEYAGSDSNGADWDLFGGDIPPDAYVSVRINGESIGTTSVAYNDYTPTWDEEFVFSYTRSTELSFRFFDEDDVSGNDYGGECFVRDLAGAIRDGGRSESIPGIAVDHVTYTIGPR